MHRYISDFMPMLSFFKGPFWFLVFDTLKTASITVLKPDLLKWHKSHVSIHLCLNLKYFPTIDDLRYDVHYFLPEIIN